MMRQRLIETPECAQPASNWTRRRLLRAGVQAGGVVGAGLASGVPAALASRQLDPSPQIRSRVQLGKTGLKVPDISFGSFSLESDEALVLHALERGITHFDTAEGYTEGHAEEVIGRALRGRRHEVTITSKYWAVPENRAADQMKVLEGSLRRLKTDYIDIYLNHAVNEVARLESEEWQAFVSRAKQQGRSDSPGCPATRPDCRRASNMRWNISSSTSSSSPTTSRNNQVSRNG